jgi:membrane protease subunit HflK
MSQIKTDRRQHIIASAIAVLAEYVKAPGVTRQRLYLETLERVMGSVQKVIIDSAAQGGQGVVPYLPLSELRSGGAN